MRDGSNSRGVPDSAEVRCPPQEVLPPLSAQPVRVQRNPFVSSEPPPFAIPEGVHLSTIVEQVASLLPVAVMPYLEVWVGEVMVPRDLWRVVTPKAGVLVTLRVRPAGGKGGKNILRSVLMIAAVVALTALTAGADAPLAGVIGSISGTLGVSTAAVAAGIVAVGTLAVSLALNALIPPPGLAGSTSNPTNYLAGSSNQMAPYGYIPRVFGKVRTYPILIGHPYTEIISGDQYLRMLLLVGYGPLSISDIRIGNTPLADYQGAQYQINEGGPTGWAGNASTSLYSRDIHEQAITIAMVKPLTTILQTTLINTVEISLDITFTTGLITYTKKGEKKARECDFYVEYTETGKNNWRRPVWVDKQTDQYYLRSDGYLRVSDQQTDAVLVGGRWTVDAGQYDVRITRTTAQGVSGGTGDSQVDLAYWTALRSVTSDVPVVQEGVCLIAIRLKATDQISGTPDTISCLAQAYLPVTTNGINWNFTLTRNPAWAYADIFRRRGNATMIADRRIDIPTIIAWAADCDAAAPNADEAHWTYDGVISGGSVFNAANAVAAIGRASFNIRDGKFSVVRDLVQATPVQHFTPRNSWGYSGTMSYVDKVDALRVTFFNEDENYQADEVIVYEDGVTADTATLYDTLDLSSGCVRKSQAWREGRYHQAVQKLRPEQHTLNTDIENLRCSRGDLVLLSHDVILVGLGYGRVSQVHYLADGTADYLVLDSDITMAAGKTYVIRCRHSDGTTSVAQIRNDATAGAAETTTQPYYAAPIAGAQAPAAGDLFMFGESGLETEPCIVRKIERGNDFAAKITLVAYNEGIPNAGTAPLPAYESYITYPTPPAQLAPAAPLVAIRSDDTATDVMTDGTVLYRMAIDIQAGGGGAAPAAGWQVQFRQTGGSTWSAPGPDGYTRDVSTVYIDNLRVGASYDVRVRAVSAAGVPSDWVTPDPHTIVGKVAAPDGPSNGVVTPIYRGNSITWTDPQDLDLQAVIVFASPSLDVGVAVEVGRSSTGRFDHDNQDIGVTFYYWLEALNTSGIPSGMVYVGFGETTAFPDFVNIGSDSVLAVAEKVIIIQSLADILNQEAAFDARAAALGVDHTGYDNNIANLKAYLWSLSPAWNDTTQSTTIDRDTWDSLWEAAKSATAQIESALLAQAATLATWAGVADTDGTKPSDGADVTAVAVAAATGKTIEQISISLDTLETKTDDLVNTYGDTQSAAAYAAASLAAQQDAAASAKSATSSQGAAASSASAAAGSGASALASAAAADSSAALSASVGNSALNANPVFSSWPTSTGSPTGWNSPSGAQVTGAISAYAVALSGGQEISNVTRPRIVNGAYLVIELDLRATGSLNDFNVGIQTYASGGTDVIGGWTYTLGSTAPIDHNNSPVVTANNTTLRYRIFVDARLSAARDFRIYAGINSGSALTAKIDRCDFRIATPGDIAGMQALPIAQQAQVNISTEANVRASGDTAIGERIDDIDALVGNQGADISTIQQTAANDYSSTAQQIAAVSSFASAGTNLSPPLVDWIIKNGIASLASGVGTGWGDYIIGQFGSTGEFAIATSPNIAVDGGATYTLSADALVAVASTGYLYFDWVAYRSDGSQTQDGNNSNIVTPNGNFSDTRDRSSYCVTQAVPSDAAYVVLRVIGANPNASGLALLGFRKVKFERGSTVTAYTIEGEAAAVSASVKITEQTVTDVKNRIDTAKFEVDVVAGTSRGLLKISADGYGSSELDLAAGSLHLYGVSGGTAIEALSVDDTGKVTIPNLAVGQISYDNLNFTNLRKTGGASWSGSLKADPGQTVNVPNFPFVVAGIRPGGFFLASIYYSITSNAASNTSTYNGKPLYTTIINDYSFKVSFKDANGNEYILNTGNFLVFLENLASQNFDATVNAILTAGSQDTGIVNEGDYYSRTISATPTITGLTVAPLRWTAF